MASYIMAGRIQAAIFVVLSTMISLVIPPFIIFNNAAIALITLRKGWKQGFIYTLLATVTLMVISNVLAPQANTDVTTSSANWFPIILMAGVLVISSALALTEDWGKSLQLTLLFGVAGILLFHLVYPDTEEYWKAALEQVKPLLQKATQLDVSVIDKAINSTANWMTVTYAISLVVTAIISLIVARNWQARLYNPGGFGEEFRKITIGKEFAIALLIGMALAVISKNQLFIELIMVGVVVFMFQGLSLAHALVKQREMNTSWLVVMYILILILQIYMIVLLATFGIIDNFVDFRKKTATNNQD